MEVLQRDTVVFDGAPRAEAGGVPKEKLLAAYNSAFVELNLRFRWDEAMYDWLCGMVDCERSRIARYLEEYHAHLLTAYDAPFLSQLILDRKNAYLAAMAARAN